MVVTVDPAADAAYPASSEGAVRLVFSDGSVQSCYRASELRADREVALPKLASLGSDRRQALLDAVDQLADGGSIGDRLDAMAGTSRQNS